MAVRPVRTAVTKSLQFFSSTPVDSLRSTGVYMLPMATKNHKRSMSQPERAFWRDAFLKPPWMGGKLDEHIRMAADYADAAVDEYRKRVTWRSHE